MDKKGTMTVGDEVALLLAEIKIELARKKDETYRLIADSKPQENCQCLGCKAQLKMAHGTAQLLANCSQDSQGNWTFTNSKGETL